jgi:AcrR family transcriptional regulator
MARIVKEEEFAARRNEIITVAQRLVYTKGYEQMAIQDILDELHISKGAFYHYFGSKVALLEALIEKMKEEALQLIIPIVEDPHLPTLEKIQRFFDTAARWKTARKTYILSLVRVWYADENAIVRQKVLTKVIIETAPLLTGIIRQGIQEGILNTPFPDQAGEIVLFLMQSLGDAFIPLLLSGETKGDEFQRTESLVAAYTDALERILGAPTGSLQLIDTATLKEWVPSPT